MGIEFVRLPEVDPADITDLMSTPAVRRHMPLASGSFGDVDIALVLGRPAWGLGELIHREILQRVFDALAPESVTALLPATRGSAHALLRLGYAPDGAAEIGGHPFRRYRLRPPKKLSSLKRGCHATGRVVGVPRVGNR